MKIKGTGDHRGLYVAGLQLADQSVDEEQPFWGKKERLINRGGNVGAVGMSRDLSVEEKMEGNIDCEEGLEIKGEFEKQRDQPRIHPSTL